MKLLDLLTHYSDQLEKEREAALTRGLDAPVEAVNGQLVRQAGAVHLYRFAVPADAALFEDVPLTILPPGDLDPAEGLVVGMRKGEALVEAYDAIGPCESAVTLVPDTSGWCQLASSRLADMAARPEYYTLGPAERLVPWLDPGQAGSESVRPGASGTVLTTLWQEDPATRRTTLTSLVVDLVRRNKRVLLIGPTHQAVDDITGAIARSLRAGALQYKSLLSRYEVSVLEEASGMALQDLGFEMQMHQFFAKSRADKAALRRKYDRFRELTPLLAYKTEKQRDLREVQLLEWRLFNELSEVQKKIKDIDATVAEYESLPIWKRMGMQAMGKNVETLGEYRAIHQQKVQQLLGEIEVAKGRSAELTPEATIPKDIRPEYEDLKEEIERLGGTRRVRELLAAEEGTNRQAFIQNKRVLLTTAARVVTDPLFQRLRFDVLIADEAPWIHAPLLLGAAGLARERVVLSGDGRDIGTGDQVTGASSLWRQFCFPQLLETGPT